VFKSHRKVQIFIDFANFYRRFTKYFSRIVANLTNLLKKEKKRKFNQKFVFISETKKTFEELKRAFISALMLIHFNVVKNSYWNWCLRICIIRNNIAVIWKRESMTFRYFLFWKNDCSWKQLYNWRNRNARYNWSMSLTTLVYKKNLTYDSNDHRSLQFKNISFK
jgi:hypothetical protein